MSSNKSQFKPFLPFIAGGVIVAIISFATVFALRSNNDEPTNATAVASSTSEDSSLGSKQNPHQVSLTKDQTKPVDLLIDVGDYVQFNSKDGGEHQIIQGKPTADHGHDEYADAVHGEEHGAADSPLDSGVFKADEGYIVQFNDVGKYEFHDNYNHDYEISIIVYDKDKKLEDTKIE
jgi:plastocyanin